MASDNKYSCCSQMFFRSGQLILLTGFVCFVIGLSTSHWVERPVVDFASKNIDPLQTLVTQHYGVFVACRQNPSESSNERGKCGSLWENLNFVDADAARLVQALMILSAVLYLFGFVLEVVQLVPLDAYRNFIAQNRLVEMFSGIAAVVALVSMVIYAGEVKNKAERIDGQDEETVGWSFVLALIGLLMCTVGCMLVTMFRDLPDPKPGEKGGTWMRF